MVIEERKERVEGKGQEWIEREDRGAERRIQVFISEGRKNCRKE